MKRAMNVDRICFLGTRTANFDATAAFFRDVLGLDTAHAEPGWSIFQLPSGNGDYVEVYGPEKQNPMPLSSPWRVCRDTPFRHSKRSFGLARGVCGCWRATRSWF